MQPQIFDETHPLEEVLVWGEPGIEALLGQLIPKSKSLFFSYYEVLEACEQFKHLQSLIESEGIKVVRAKDAVARVLANRVMDNAPSNRIELESLLLQKANELYETYRLQKMADLEKEGIPNDIDKIYKQIKIDIQQVLEEDIQTYGEKSAISAELPAQPFKSSPSCQYLLWKRPNANPGRQDFSSRHFVGISAGPKQQFSEKH